MNSIITLNELNQFQQAEDLRRESFVKQICKMEEYIFAKNTSIANKLSEYKDIQFELTSKFRFSMEDTGDFKYMKMKHDMNAEDSIAREKAYLAELSKLDENAKKERMTKDNFQSFKYIPYTKEYHDKKYAQILAAKERREKNENSLKSGMQMMKIYKTLINYDVKRIKLFERAKKIGMGSAEWSHFNEYLNTIEQKILTNLEFDDFYLLINDIEKLFIMVSGLLTDKLAHCMARPIRMINNLIDSGKNLVNKVISAIKPEGRRENAPLTIDEWRKLEEAMSLKHKNAVYLEKKLSDAKRIGEKNPSKIRNMIVDLMIKESPNVLSS